MNVLTLAALTALCGLAAPAFASAGAIQPSYHGDSYPGDLPAASGRTRAEVRAEVREAERFGLLEPTGDGNYRVATPEQERLIAEAGEHARLQQLAAVGH